MRTKISLIALILLVFTSCKKDDPIPPTTYCIVNNIPTQTTTIKYLDGTLWLVIVYCYDASGDIVHEDSFESIASGGGESIKTEVTDDIVKLVVSYMMVPRESEYYSLSSNYRRYTKIKFSLVHNEENKIEITGETTVSGTLSKYTPQTLIKDFQNEVESKK